MLSKAFKIVFWLVVGLFVLASLAAWLATAFVDETPTPPQVQSPAQLRKDVVQRAINQGEVNMIAAIKAAMHDPDSFDLVDDRALDAGDHITMVMTYRGKNGFNATRTETVGATLDLNGTITSMGKVEK